MAEYKGKFPTRFGPATGGANERRMLDVVGGAEGIRSRVQFNDDGSKTTLKTRAGMPNFDTEGGRPEYEREPLPTCAAIPVGVSGPWGFSYDSQQSQPFTPLDFGVESIGASAELEVRSSKVRFHYNERGVTGPHKKDQYHPGNRTWFDHRTTNRTTAKVISWWAPFDTCLRVDYSWYSPDSPWIGDMGISAQRTSREAQYGNDMGGMWNPNRGVVFIDGNKVCDFECHILAAAFHSTLNAVFALTTDVLELSVNGSGISSTPFFLRKYDLATKEVSVVADLGGAWWTTERCPSACFSPDAEYLLAPLNIPVDYQPSIYKVTTRNGAKELLRPVEDDVQTGGGWVTRTTLAMRFDEAGEVKYAHEDVLSTSNMAVTTINIEGVDIATATGAELWNGSAYHFSVTGDLATIIQHDGYGGYLIALRDSFSWVATGDQLIPNSATWVSSHPGTNYTWFTEPAGAFPSQATSATTDMPLFFMMAGTQKADWTPIPNITLGCRLLGGKAHSLPRTMIRSWVDANSNIAPLGGPNQKQLMSAVAVDPSTGTRIVTARIRGGVAHEVNVSYQEDHYDSYLSLACSVVLRLQENGIFSITPVVMPWGGDLPTLNSPVFYARKGRLWTEFKEKL